MRAAKTLGLAIGMALVWSAIQADRDATLLTRTFAFAVRMPHWDLSCHVGACFRRSASWARVLCACPARSFEICANLQCAFVLS